LVDLGLASSRERAKALVMADRVLVADAPAKKPGDLVALDAPVRLRGGVPEDDYASRGALKLAPALDTFGVDVAGAVCIDVGASTGGFTDVLLRRGATRVYAVDVGYGQLDQRLSQDARVVVLDRVNARQLGAEHVPELADLAVIDVSFISLTLVLGAVASRLRPGGSLLAMIKPQFEVGKGRLGKGGVVRDEAVRQEAIARVTAFARELGLEVAGLRDNDIRGPKGNLECFFHGVTRRLDSPTSLA
jgi:23S rRNA (cytidine1920-2'-O)/16S rRNA (cytidine1409-2'-O)-methyltransferase